MVLARTAAGLSVPSSAKACRASPRCPAVRKILCGVAKAADGEFDLENRAAAGAADSLILKPYFAPAACWCACTMVLSMTRYSKSGSSAMAVKTRCQTLLALQRLYRR